MKSIVLVIGLAVGAAGAGCGGSGTASDQPKPGANTSSSPASEGVASDAKGIQTVSEIEQEVQFLMSR